jgi:hypothetical protein
MRMYGTAGILLHAFLSLAVDESGQLHDLILTQGERNPEHWAGPITCLEGVKQKISWKSNHSSLLIT